MVWWCLREIHSRFLNRICYTKIQIENYGEYLLFFSNGTVFLFTYVCMSEFISFFTKEKENHKLSNISKIMQIRK